LDQPRVAGAQHLAEGTAVDHLARRDVAVYLAELSVVGEVEEFRPKLQIEALGRAVFFMTLKSTLLMPGPQQTDRGEFPMRPISGCWNDDGSKARF
jgi:hypothetical protein